MMKRVALTSALALLVGAATAGAAPIPLPTNEPVYGQFNNLEQNNLANNLVVPGYAPAALEGNGLQGSWGVINISTLQHGGVVSPGVDISGGGAFFTDTGGGIGSQGQITGIFYGVDFLSPTTSTGGVVDLFWHDPGTSSIDANCLSGATCGPNAATVGLFTSGIFLARLRNNSGIDAANPLVFTKTNIDPTTPGGSGHADSFLDVDLSAGGLWASQLNGNWFTLPGQPVPVGFTPRDLRFSTFFNIDVASWNGPGGTAGVRSNDPVRVFTTAAVPEPATLTLLGIGLAGLGYRRRKKA
jgi:hypothetical protein